MKFSAIITVLALAISATALPQAPRGLNRPLFTCDIPGFGGCCSSFVGETGLGCHNATYLAKEEFYTCNDSTDDVGLPACCHTIPHPPGTHIGILLPCAPISDDY